MFNYLKTKSSRDESIDFKIETVIASNTEIHGDIGGDGAIRIDGLVVGNIRSNNGLIVGEKGKIEGNVNASRVIIYGRVDGDLECKTLSLSQTGLVNGNLTVETLSVEVGGKYNGTLKMVLEHTKPQPISQEPVLAEP